MKFLLVRDPKGLMDCRAEMELQGRRESEDIQEVEVLQETPRMEFQDFRGQGETRVNEDLTDNQAYLANQVINLTFPQS